MLVPFNLVTHFQNKKHEGNFPWYSHILYHCSWNCMSRLANLKIFRVFLFNSRISLHQLLKWSWKATHCLHFCNQIDQRWHRAYTNWVRPVCLWAWNCKRTRQMCTHVYSIPWSGMDLANGWKWGIRQDLLSQQHGQFMWQSSPRTLRKKHFYLAK